MLNKMLKLQKAKWKRQRSSVDFDPCMYFVKYGNVRKCTDAEKKACIEKTLFRSKPTIKMLKPLSSTASPYSYLG